MKTMTKLMKQSRFFRRPRQYKTSNSRKNCIKQNNDKNLRRNLKIKINQNKRGERKNSKNFRKNLRFLGVNAAGLQSKLFSFKKVLSDLKPSVFFIEETKTKQA